MKTLLLLLVFTISASAQVLTEKWNTYNNRYEYFDSNNNLVGYKTYNPYKKQYEYYEVEQYKQPVRRDENFELLAQIQLNKQRKFDANYKAIQTTINSCYEIVDELEHLTYSQKQKIKNRFSKEYVSQLQGTKVDISIDANSNKIIDWLFDGIVNLCKQENK